MYFKLKTFILQTFYLQSAGLKVYLSMLRNIIKCSLSLSTLKAAF